MYEGTLTSTWRSYSYRLILKTKASDDLEPILTNILLPSPLFRSQPWREALSLSLSSFWSFVVDSFSFDYFRGGGPQLSIAQLTTDGNGSEKCPLPS